MSFSKGSVFFKVMISSAAVLGATYFICHLHKRKKRRNVGSCWEFRRRDEKDIKIVSNVEEWESVYPVLSSKCSVIKAVGFDCEWVVSSKVSLVQIATVDGFCVLVRIHMLSPIPQSLTDFLADKSILKVGVASRDDGRKLFKDYGLAVSGCVDLRHIISRVPSVKCSSQGLSGLASSLLGIRMVKDHNIRCGDWEAESFSQAQVNYAADDALVGLDVFLQLVWLKFGDVAGDNSYYGNSVTMAKEDFFIKARSLCQGVVNAKFKMKSSRNMRESVEISSEEEENDSGTINNQTSTFRKSSQNRKSNQSGKKGQLLAPNGDWLSPCDILKAEWYIRKELGDKVSDDPFTVKLRFEPKNRRNIKKDNNLQKKESMCVVCGSYEDCVRKQVVPQEYRKYFPANQKDHSSHDVLLLCRNCHRGCGDYETTLRQRLAVECDAPLEFGKDSKRHIDKNLAEVSSAAKALFRNLGRIPEERVAHLENTVKNYCGVKSLSDKLLKDAIDMDTKVQNSQFVPHGQKVVQFYMQKHGGLLEFEKLWRVHFVEAMQPQFLPDLWAVEHEPEQMIPVLDDLNGFCSLEKE
ncbi:exonuclease 3'-5' domain-containing protein 2-like isoform X2 [Mya arenaria]|uniref:exonuclease 3'-5' domain-containing protein 2-like isoform X2 n=1 Tax=Mya arenaria TaxID=6604 RepID=UPI0022E7E465|nr:exonuclease 3'-5' domain-containing protein 2-like isoform X2 [Mya arenaria]